MAYYGWSNDPREGQSIYDAYVAKMAGFVCWLLERGHPVRLLMGEIADDRAVQDVLRLVALAKPDLAEGWLLAEPAASLRDVMQQIAETDLVVATRFHNVVCALKLGRPTVSLGYARKNDVLLAEMGLGAFCQHVEAIDLDLLKTQFGSLLAGLDTYRQQIRQTVSTYRDQLERQAEVLRVTVARG